MDLADIGYNSDFHGLLGIPDEILLNVISHLDRIQDIIALGEASRRLHDLTQDRSVWLQILREEAPRLPLPRHIRNALSWTRLSSQDLMSVVRRLRRVDQTWLFPRTHYFVPGHRLSCALDPVYDNDDGARSIYSLDIFLDRWLLCVYQEKLVEIWDLDSVLHDPHKPILCTSHGISGSGSFSSAITHLDEESKILTVAVSCHELCQVLQVQLSPSSAFYTTREDQDLEDVQFRTVAVMPIHSPVLCLRAVDPSQALLLLSLPSTFHLLNWETKQRIIVHMLSEEEEELWNGVVGATFLTSRHILLLKAHSIEVCTLLDSHDPSQRPISPEAAQDRPGSSAAPSSCSFEKHMLAVVHSHYLPSTTFRGASFAQPVLHHVGAASSQPELSQVSTSFLAFDVLRGLFHFSVSVTLPPSLADMNHVIDASTPIDVDVKLLASHNMALPIATHPPLEGPFRPTESGGLFSRSGLSHGTRGFVSSCALGPSGRRGVWVERRRGAVRRVVYGFDAVTRSPVADSFWYPEGAAAGLWEAGSTVDAPMETSHHAGGRAAPIKGREMYEVNSYDLRDDITHIAFAEATGLIALGTRKGDIRVLCRAEAD